MLPCRSNFIIQFITVQPRAIYSCMPVLTKVYFRPPVEFVQVLCEKKWWSILVTRTTLPVFNQLTTGLLHSVLH